jgi:hypothetical protein
MLLRRKFGPKRKEVTENCRILHNEELYALYSSPNIIRAIKSRRLKWAEYVAHMKKKDASKFPVRKPEGKTPYGRPRRRWDYKVKMDFREII